MLKKCIKCKQDKPVTEFHKHSRMKHGVDTICKVCKSEYGKQYRAQNQELLKQKMRDWWWANRDAALERKKQRDTETGRLIASRAKYNNRNPSKRNAKKAVASAVQSNDLPKISDLKCKSCGNKAEHYHHWSYLPEHWLSVVPVCVKCHGAIHRGALAVEPSDMAIDAEA